MEARDISSTSTVNNLNHMDSTELSFVEKFKRQPPFRGRVLFTAYICWSFTMLGWVESLLGPTLPDLRLVIDEALDAASWLFTATSVGFLAGSVLIGATFERCNSVILLLLSIIGTAVTLVAVPWCPYLALMLAAKFLNGLAAASLDTSGNAEVVNIWDQQAGPYMQALHFCFSLGGMIAPLMAQPFLATKIPASSLWTLSTENAHSTENDSSHNLENLNNITNDTLIDALDVYGKTRVQYAYMITAGLILITAIPFVCILFTKRGQIQKVNAGEKRISQSEFDRLPILKKLIILGILSLLMVVYCGTEDTFAGFLMTFTISQLHWSKSAGSVATSIHWICFGIGRLGAVVFVRFIRTSRLLYIFSIMIVVSFSCLLTATLTDISILVWIFIGCSGFSMSVIFPAIFTWTNEHVVPVSGKISAMFLTSSSLGVMLFPLLFGYTMDRLGPIWFLYLLLGQSIVWVILFTLSIIVVSAFIKSKVGAIELEIHRKESDIQ